MLKQNLCCLETDEYYETIPSRVYCGVPVQPERGSDICTNMLAIRRKFECLEDKP